MSPRPSVTIKDIALHAGVSTATVSRALRNDPRQSSRTRDRVREIATRLGYRPNPLVSVLMAGIKRNRQHPSSNVLAFVTTHSSVDGWRNGNPSFVEYYEGAKERASSQGYTVEAFWLYEPGMTTERFSRMLYTRNIRGVLLPPLARPVGHLSLEWQRFASVAIGHTLRRPSLSRAMTDFYQGVLLALRQLRRCGHVRIGFAVDIGTDQRVQHAWQAGYLVFQQSLPPRHRLPPFLFPNSNGSGLREWLQVVRPTAVVGMNNDVLTWLKRAGAEVPKDIDFVSLNTGRTSCDPPGINQQSKLVGATAVDLVIGQLQRNEYGIPAHPTLTLVPGVWADGKTFLSPPQGNIKRAHEC